MLIITGGDPLSTNIEAMAALLGPQAPDVKPDTKVVLILSRFHWEHQLNQLDPKGAAQPTLIWMATLEEIRAAKIPGPYGLDIGSPDLQRPADQLTDQERGLLACRALEQIPTCRDHPLAVVTGPIDKAACAAADFPFVGQTEFFQDRWDHPAVMILAGDRLRVGLVTNHLPLSQVATKLSSTLVEDKLQLFARSLRQSFGIAQPKIAVCGLNPHAGDRGLLGHEDDEVIRPAIEAAATGGLNVTGPLPADTAFYQAFHGAFDGVLAMYHDQGLGPLKLVHFDSAVNLSGGLPHLRVSPDHGPAADRYLKKTLKLESWRRAYELAEAYLEHRR